MIGAKIWALLGAIALYCGSCLGSCVGLTDDDRRETDPELARWADRQDAYWNELSSRDDAHNARMDQRAEEQRQRDIFDSVREFRLSHHESPRTTGDVRQWTEREVMRDAVKRDARRHTWIKTLADGTEVEVKPRLDDEDKEAEEAARYAR